MSWTKTQIGSIRYRLGQTPKFYGWSECEHISCRISYNSRIEDESKRTVKRWYWRGKFGRDEVKIPLGQDGPAITPAWLKAEDRRIMALIEAGIDPRGPGTEEPVSPAALPELTFTVPTMDEAWSEYQRIRSEDMKPQAARTKDEQGKDWVRYVSKAVGHFRVDQVTMADIENLVFTPMRQKGIHTAANHVHRILSAFWNKMYRVYPGMIPNPVTGRKQNPEEPGERLFSHEELGLLGATWKTLDQSSFPLKFNLIFLLLTGCRAGVVMNFDMNWFKDGDRLEIDKDTPGVKKARLIVLPPKVRGILKEIEPCTKNTLRHSFNKLLKLAGVDKACFNDCRRTYITEASDSCDLPDEVALALTSHLPSKINQTYIKKRAKKLAGPSVIVADHLLGLLGIEPVP